MNKKLVTIIVILVIIIAGSLFVWQMSDNYNTDNGIQVYENTKDGYSLEIPDNWRVETTQASTFIIPNNVAISTLPVEGIDITVKEQSLEELLNSDVLTDPYSQPQTFEKWRNVHEDLEEITVNGIRAIQFTETLGGHGDNIEWPTIYWVVISLDDKTIEFRSDITREIKLKEIVNSFKKI